MQYGRLLTATLVGLLAGSPVLGSCATAAERAPSSESTPSSAPPPAAIEQAPAAETNEQIVQRINELIRAEWTALEITPAPAVADGKWCRRVYLDLIGRIPTPAELQRFLADKDPGKREKLVDSLLASDDYIYHWGTVWTNLLIGREAGNDPQDLTNREGLQKFLRDSLAREMPYDKLVFELLTARGVNKPGEEDFNGAVNYLLDKLGDNAIQATSHASRLFLGMQVQCTQCHNHPFNEWNQDQFWGINAFFRQTRPLRTREGRDIVSVRLEDEDFPGEGVGGVDNAAIYYENRDATLQAVFPTFVDGTKINRSGYLDEVNRRGELAKLVVGSEFLPQAIVNRTWGQFFTHGFTKPVDDMGPHNAVSHPDLLEYLAGQFTAGGYDLRRLHRWITLSEPYALSSEPSRKGAELDDPEAGQRPLFSRFYIRQMTAEQLYESLLAATSAANASAGSADERQRQKDRWLAQFATAFATDEGGEASTFDGTIPQALMMMNGDLIKEATACKPGTFLHQTATATGASDRQRVERLFLAALARRPSSSDYQVAGRLFQARQGDTPAALEDLWWALLNCNEFILIH